MCKVWRIKKPRFDAIRKFEIIPMKCRLWCMCTGMSTGGNTPGRSQDGRRMYPALQEEPFHALLDIDAEGSGKFVTEVRKNINNHKG